MLISETHWGNRTAWVSPSFELEPANPSIMQSGSAELGSLPKTDGKSEMEHGQEGTVDHPDFSGKQGMGTASKTLDVQEIAIHLPGQVVRFLAPALHWTVDTCALLGSSHTTSTAT